MIRPAAKWGCATAALVLAIAAGVPAGADTSYLKPNFFTTANADIVTVQSSFTEDFPNPNVAVKSDAWTVIGPDGQIAGHIDLRARMEKASGHRCLLGMGVQRAWRRQGLGAALIGTAPMRIS